MAVLPGWVSGDRPLIASAIPAAGLSGRPRKMRPSQRWRARTAGVRLRPTGRRLVRFAQSAVGDRLPITRGRPGESWPQSGSRGIGVPIAFGRRHSQPHSPCSPTATATARTTGRGPSRAWRGRRMWTDPGGGDNGSWPTRHRRRFMAEHARAVPPERLAEILDIAEDGVVTVNLTAGSSCSTGGPPRFSGTRLRRSSARSWSSSCRSDIGRPTSARWPTSRSARSSPGSWGSGGWWPAAGRTGPNSRPR